MKVKLYISGGAWYYDDWCARCAYRNKNTPGNRDLDVGFRCCFSPSFVIKRKIKQ